MSNLPKVTLLYSNGNLLLDVAAVDGIMGIVGTGETAGLLGVPKVVFSLPDAVDQGFTEDAEPYMYRHLSEFYSEVGGNKELHVMIVPDTITMTQMLTDATSNGAKKLLDAAQGKVRILGAFRHPGEAYDGGEDFIDSDVSTAVTAAKTFAGTRLDELRPLRVIVEGRVANPSAANTLQPKTLTNGFAGVALGGSEDDGSASIGLLLGRAARYGAHEKIGKVANGPLNINRVYIGDKELKDVLNLDTLHGDGFISFMTHPQKAGFFFGIDRMCSVDDYRLLAYGRVIDKAALIAAQVYVEQIEDTVDLEANGNIASHEITHLKTTIEQQILVVMGEQISAVTAIINPAQNIVSTGRIRIRLQVQPLGYKSFIEVEIGLAAPAPEA